MQHPKVNSLCSDLPDTDTGWAEYILNKEPDQIAQNRSAASDHSNQLSLTRKSYKFTHGQFFCLKSTVKSTHFWILQYIYFLSLCPCTPTLPTPHPPDPILYTHTLSTRKHTPLHTQTPPDTPTHAPPTHTPRTCRLPRASHLIEGERGDHQNIHGGNRFATERKR